jgi:wobble nucleotide-excising tRNase
MSTVAEAQVHAAETRFATSFDSAVKGAPSGSETMTAVVKSVVDAASNAMDTLHKASKQATDLAAANLNTMSLSTIKATHAKPPDPGCSRLADKFALDRARRSWARTGRPPMP